MITIELNSTDIRKLIIEHFEKKFPGVTITSELVEIQVKSTQNYKSEWETAAFKAKIILPSV